MRLSITYLKEHEDEYVLKHVKPRKSNPVILEEEAYKANKKEVWICNPYIESSTNKWRNCAPLKAFICDTDYKFGYTWENVTNGLKEAQDQNHIANINYYKSFSHGYYAYLADNKSFYNEHNYSGVDVINLDYVFSDNFKETPYYEVVSLSRIENQPYMSIKCLKKFIAIFDNEKEAKRYINDIKENPSIELDRLNEEISRTKENIYSLLEHLKNLKEQKAKLINK